MALKQYGLLKGRPIARRLATSSNAHYQIHIVDETTDYRIAVNVKSKLAPSELEYLIVDDFRHPVTAQLAEMPIGYHILERKPGSMALDFIRGNLFDRQQMRPLPFDVPGPVNDLNELIDQHIQLAMTEEDALVYAFGERWGPENVKDKIFGFRPGNGIHDIHMNQGNHESFRDQDGVWQDGAMLIHFPSQNRWVGVFLKFQSQTWHTDDVNGHRIEAPEPPVDEPTNPDIEGETDKVVRIIAALVNPLGGDPEVETVTILNTAPDAINLDGWAIADRMKRQHVLSGMIGAGEALLITLSDGVSMSNKGGLITLLNAQGLKVDGVSYTKEQAKNSGWTIVF
ncbi:MAG: DUF2278 family protein [Anaerolineae bacterium]|nr:DUF2278 family protein [Anaerolineae bacterium]